MSSKHLKRAIELEYTPEESAVLMRLRVFISMRWLAIVGVVIVTMMASNVFQISFPTLPVYIICLFMATYNLVSFFQVRRLKKAKAGLVVQKVRTYSNIHIFLDLLMLTVLLHFTGGITNPFIFYYVFHIILASISLHYRVVYLLATSVMAMVILLVGLEYFRVIPHINLVGFAAPDLYLEASYILAILVALATILYATTYTATAISGELRKRQRQIVQLREQLIEEKTGELEQASRDVAKLEEEKGRFLRFISIAAHDLKAPLTAIQGFLWIMLGGYSGKLTDKQRNMLDRSTRRITELLNLISDLLDIPRIETGHIIPEMKEISFREVVKHSHDELRSAAKEKGIKLKVELKDEHLPKIKGSSSRLRQVMANLIGNAINYTSEGEVIVRIREESDDLRIEVMDTGIGIPSDDLPHLFDDFFRASNVEVKGTGLGLSIVKRIVEAHGGKIWVESPSTETGTGSKFTFTLPKSDKHKRRKRR